MNSLEHTLDYSILSHPGFVEWNAETWDLTPVPVAYRSGSIANGAGLTGVLYTDKSGRVRMPPRNPYTPLHFTPTSTSRADRLIRQQLDLLGRLADDIAGRGLRGTLIFDPTFGDARAFQWREFSAEYRYTYAMRLPAEKDAFASAVRKRIRKAEAERLTVEATDDFHAVATCLAATENRKGFTHGTGARELQRLAELVGEQCRIHVVRTAEGKAVSAGVRLFPQGGTAVELVQGTTPEGLSLGASQLIQFAAIAEAGTMAMSYDLSGANIESVASAKSGYGDIVVRPTVALRQNSFLNAGRGFYSATRSLHARVRSRAFASKDIGPQ